MNSSSKTAVQPSHKLEKVNELDTVIASESDPVTSTLTAIETPRSTKKVGFPKHNRSIAPTRPNHIDDVDYFENLLRDLAEISRLLSQNPSRFRYAHLSLMEEVFAVWDRIRFSSIFTHPPPAPFNNNKRTSPPKSGSSTNGSPLNTRSSFGSHNGASPSHNWRYASGGDRMAPFSLANFEPVFEDLPIHMHKIEKKIFIPEVPNYNFIGRILGPRGISARQIEADTNCKILIRGKGSVKDPEKEKRLIGQPGYEHLTEDLHVHITAEGMDLAECQRHMDRAVSIIEALLTPTYDEYKKTQLLQLAIINGTYRPMVKKKKPKSEY